MSHTYEDAQQDEFYDRLYNEFGPQWADDHAEELYHQNYADAIKEFTAERLQSYYLKHPDLAHPALQSLAYARSRDHVAVVRTRRYGVLCRRQ